MAMRFIVETKSTKHTTSLDIIGAVAALLLGHAIPIRLSKRADDACGDTSEAIPTILCTYKVNNV